MYNKNYLKGEIGMEEKGLSEIYHLIEKLPKDTIIGEFAGRDSVAAILKAMEDSSIRNILPVASFSPTEYGNIQILESNYEKMLHRTKELYGNRKTIYPLIYYSNFDLWTVINGRFVDYIIKKFGFYTPCIGCHAYFHLLRIAMALRLGKKIIAGERESHDGRIKINQRAEALKGYEKIARALGVELIMPIRYIEDGAEVERIIGWDWQEGKGHQTCAFSKNYIGPDGKVTYNKDMVEKFIDKYLYPVSVALGRLLIQEGESTKEKMLQTLMNRSGIF